MKSVNVKHYFGASEKCARAFIRILPSCLNINKIELVEKKRAITAFILPRRGVS